MAQLIADRKDIDFVLYEQLQIQWLMRHARYQRFNRQTFDLILAEARHLAIKELLSTYREADRQDVRFEKGRIKLPPCLHRAYRLLVQGSWSALTDEPDLGGQGLPVSLAQAVHEYLMGANFAFMSIPMLSRAAGNMIERFGSAEQKAKFVEKLYTLAWTGTMLLTEPQAGSDVGALTTTAIKNQDGTYSLSGSKIFISNADHDLTPNIIHAVLARVQGAPPGTKGISLFLVPQQWVNPDGSLGEPNDIAVEGIEAKMGLHGMPTASVTLGSRGKCRGLLVGAENQGMPIMFHMMNEARLHVGALGLCNASCAYLYALDYARQRRQGRDLSNTGDRGAPAVPIINHPDVRRMLLAMKAQVEGMRSFIYFLADCFDRMSLAADQAQRAHYAQLTELLIPVAKAYCTDRGFEVCVQALQVYGGYGYIRDYPVEQLVRDAKANSLYEGTNGIQAMDLVGRKLGMHNGRVFKGLVQAMQETVQRARTSGRLDDLPDRVAQAVQRLAEVAGLISAKARSPELKSAFAFAQPFLEATGDVITAWMMLWRAQIAAARLSGYPDNNGTSKHGAFYQGQLNAAQYFIRCQIPITLARLQTIAEADPAAVAIPEAAFGG